MPAPSHTDESDLARLLGVIRRRAWLLMLCMLAAVGAAVALTVTAEEKYSAEAVLLFRDPQLDERIFPDANGGGAAENPERTIATNLELVALNAIAARTAEEVGGSVTTGEISEALDITQNGDSDLITVEMTAPAAEQAALWANTFAEEFVAFRRDSDRGKVEEALRLVEAQLAEFDPAAAVSGRVRKLAARAEDLRVLATLQTGNSEVVERASTPGSPSSPKPARNLLFGGVVGLLAGLGLVLLREQLDRRLRSPEHLRDAIGLPLLATIPKRRSFNRQHGGPTPLAAGEAEAFRMLRTNLRYFNVSREIHSVLVTSSRPGEGKSTVALNLAVAAASMGDRVMLIEADLRNPHFGQVLSADPFHGLTSVLAGARESYTSVRLRLPLSDWLEEAPPASFDVVPSGAIPPNPTELLESPRMRELLADTRNEYDLVVVDTPPVSIVSDAIPLLSAVDGVIVVAAIGSTMRDETAELREQLERLSAPTLGAVANFSTDPADSYRGYGYGYGRAPEISVSSPASNGDLERGESVRTRG